MFFICVFKDQINVELTTFYTNRRTSWYDMCKSPKMSTTFKKCGLLFDLGSGSKRHFCTSWYDICAC